MLRPASEPTVRVLEEDPDLASGLAAGRLEQARSECLADAFVMPRGVWAETELSVEGGLGLLILDGLLIRSVGVDSRYGSELLGQGDIIRPWQGDDEPLTVVTAAAWRALCPVRLARLDRRFIGSLAPWPEVSANLFGRAIMRARNLAINMAIVHHPRIHARLMILLWHLAGRWGRVVPEGVTLSLPLTHAVLAELIASRRPTVTTALGELARTGDLQPVEGGWLLLGPPPREVVEEAALGGNVSDLRR